MLNMNNKIRHRRNAMANDFVEIMFELESKNQDDYTGKFDDYLLKMFTEKEVIEKIVVISNCHCCKKHSIHKSESYLYLDQCSCKCRHYRRWLYRCLYKYSCSVKPKQKWECPVIEECESEKDDEAIYE